MPAFKDYDFRTHQGITPATHNALHKRFTGWEQLLEIKPEDLLEIRGITPETALEIVEVADGMLRADRAKKAGSAETSRQARSGERLFVISSKPADFSGPDGAGRVTNVKRRRKLVTDAICEKCGMDFVDKLGLSDFEHLSPATKDDLKRRVKAHKEMMHGLDTQMLITESELKQIVGDMDPKAKKARRAAEAAEAEA